ncbi:MAG: DUF268 domain-containing protein [Nitrospirae bacterium]|nr:DUF268 domain-containing protein [Nitrospirota bacterium]
MQLHENYLPIGDPLDPDGDLKTMKTLADKLKTDSLCFPAVPIGTDRILWNAHWASGNIPHRPGLSGGEYQPVFVLRKSG